MGTQSDRKLVAFLPLVLAATFVVVVVPMLLVVWLRSSGVVGSVGAGMVIAVTVSLLASCAGGAFWKARAHPGDILFSDLMLWGWLQRWRSEHRLTAAADVLGLTPGRPQAISGGQLTNEQKAGLLTQLTFALEARDAYTHGHSRRVARHASNTARRMGLSRAEVAKIRAAGAMHDVGKVETPITVLHKEGKLTDGEYAIIKRHPVDGAVMVSGLGDDELTAIVRHHHERVDGSGYPDGLAGEAIPIGARILAVADTFDAITSARPYRHARAHNEALDVLATEAGTQLDPDAVRAFCSCYSGRRPLAYWTMLANAGPRITSWLGSGLAPAKAATVANVMATAATAATIGSSALGVAASAGVLPSSSRPHASPQAPALYVQKEMPSKRTHPRYPGHRPLKDGGQQNHRGGHRLSTGQPQNNAHTQNNTQAQNNPRPQSQGPGHNTAQPNGGAKAPDNSRDQEDAQRHSHRDRHGQGRRQDQARDQVVSSATGSGHMVQSDGTFRSFSFTARKYADGTSKGDLRLKRPGFDVVVHIEIDCLRVVWNVAHMSGRISRVDNPDEGEVGELTRVEVRDNGEDGKAPPDQISTIPANPGDADPTTCIDPPTNTTIGTIQGGNVRVRD